MGRNRNRSSPAQPKTKPPSEGVIRPSGRNLRIRLETQTVQRFRSVVQITLLDENPANPQLQHTTPLLTPAKTRANTRCIDPTPKTSIRTLFFFILCPRAHPTQGSKKDGN